MSDILITGGTGSFGKKYVEYLLEHGDYRRIAIFSRDEKKQLDMHIQYQDERLRWFLGDVRDVERLKVAMRNITHVVHAAALKHVDAIEYNPDEAVKTNVLGAANVVAAANACGVQKVLALSTDKAVNPANCYGSTKSCMERLFTAANVYHKARFACTRYGNVHGSRGSLIERLKAGENISLTHAECTRFIMTLEHAVAFVHTALREMRGGEVMVPQLPSARVSDIIKAYRPGGSITISGLRPGEKIHEAMISPEEGRHTSAQPWGYLIHPQFPLPDDRCPLCTEPINFDYTSGKNTDWLTPEQIRELG
jgi:UDP-N-acetylglucosamine 4,6-dehydratase